MGVGEEPVEVEALALDRLHDLLRRCRGRGGNCRRRSRGFGDDRLSGAGGAEEDDEREGAPGEALSMMQAVKLKEIAAKAKDFSSKFPAIKISKDT